MILLASQNHLQEILNIERKSFSNPWTEDHFKYDLNNKISVNWIYQNDNHVIGYLFGWQVIDEYHLNNIAVQKQHRQNKIAIELFKYLKQYLEEIKVKSALLEVSSSNLSARKLYEKIGFIYKGNRKDYYTKGDDALLMHWNFNDRVV